MDYVRDILNDSLLTNYLSVSPYDNVAMVLQKMALKNQGAVLVIDEEDMDLVGVFSERDYARRLLLKGKSSLITPIHQVMTRKILYITPNYTLEEALSLMIEKKIRHIPVFENQKLVAFLSIEDVISGVLRKKEYKLAELTQYITGSLAIDYEKPKPSNFREMVLYKPKKYEINTYSA